MNDKTERLERWETPTLVEIKMDAEIGSYQADPDPLFIELPVSHAQE